MKEKFKGFTQFFKKDWFLKNFELMVDLFRHMNKLNTKLMGKVTFAHEMYSVVEALRLNLKLFSCYLI